MVLGPWEFVHYFHDGDLPVNLEDVKAPPLEHFEKVESMSPESVVLDGAQDGQERCHWVHAERFHIKSVLKEDNMVKVFVLNESFDCHEIYIFTRPPAPTCAPPPY